MDNTQKENENNAYFINEDRKCKIDDSIKTKKPIYTYCFLIFFKINSSLIIINFPNYRKQFYQHFEEGHNIF